MTIELPIDESIEWTSLASEEPPEEQLVLVKGPEYYGKGFHGIHGWIIYKNGRQMYADNVSLTHWATIKHVQ